MATAGYIKKLGLLGNQVSPLEKNRFSFRFFVHLRHFSLVAAKEEILELPHDTQKTISFAIRRTGLLNAI
jgi:hypothetical protein